MTRFALAAGLVAALLGPGPAVSRQAASVLSFDAIFAEDAAGRRPRKISWAPDGRRLGYVWPGAGGDELRVLDPVSGETKTLLLLAEANGAEALAELDAYHWSPDGAALLLESGGDLYLLSIADRGLRRLTETDAAERDPAFSPDGSRLAFTRDFDLHLLDLESGSERALTEDGEAGSILNAVTDWVYWEEIWDRERTGFWWSPKGDRIAYYRFEEAEVERYSLVDFTPLYPSVEWQRYPKAGERLPRVRLGVLELESGDTVWMDTGDDDEAYIARVRWLPFGQQVAIQRLNRAQDRLDLLLCEPAGGECVSVARDRSPTWVNLSHDLRFLPDGDFVWSSERSGWRRLYLHAAEGHPRRQFGDDLWSVTGLEAVVESRGEIFYTAHSIRSLGASHRRLFRQTLEGGVPVPMTPENAWTSVVVSPATGSFAQTTSRADGPLPSVVRDAEGELLAELPFEPPPHFDPAALPSWERFEIPGPHGAMLPAAILRPPTLDPERRYPAIMYHYGGPASQVVEDRWRGGPRDLWHRMMAQRGYVVLKVDNLASRFFGKWGEDRVHRRFGPGNLAAQLAGVEYLRGLGFVDAQRIGLWGGSGGGANTLYALTNSPGTWRAAIAVAPVTDWRLYDAIWTERYLGRPQDNPDGYAQSSAVTHAAELEDSLLIVHGTADDNVHPQNTLVMSHKLVEAGIPFEQAIYPRQKHRFRGASSRHLYERMTEFFDRHLQAPAATGGTAR
jgi:dipeptidyl-peptidase-4